MKSIFRKVLCCLVSVSLILGCGISAFASGAGTATTPVVVVNDIDYNPIVDTSDNSVVFNFSDYQYDILFTTGFSENVTELLSAEVLSQITSGDMSTMDIINMLIDYLGFSGDINSIVNMVLELVTSIMADVDFSDFDLMAILSSIDFEQYAKDIVDQIKEKLDNFDRIAVDENGVPKDASTGALSLDGSLDDISFSDSSLVMSGLCESVAEKIGYEDTYVFTYDWRIDPKDNASALNSYIKALKADLGCDKVSVISEGYGSTVAVTYLSEYASDAADDVKNFVTVSSEFLGSSVVGDYFKGDIVNEFSNLTTYTSAYIRYTNDISDNPITAFSTWLINYIMNNEWDLQAFCLHIEQLLSVFEYSFDSFGITGNFEAMPGMWALVPPDDFDDAADNVFGEDKSSELYAKVSDFKECQSDYEAILTGAKASGINISVVAAWDLQIIPIGENSSVQSDGVVDTSYASFGAECVPLNNVAEAINAVQSIDLGHDHMSATYDMLTPWYAYGGICYYIDASTCALPENTWFIKNMKHGTFNYESNSSDFLAWLITAESERTVWQMAEYKQFMNYNRYINPGILSSDGIVKNGDADTPGNYLMGDINLDGLVTSIDARLALRHAAGLEIIDYGTVPFVNGDVYADGLINAADARKILLMSSGLIDGMKSGVKLTYDTDESPLAESTYEIELRTEYNSCKNQLVLSLVIPDAEGSYSGNFVLKYDGDMLAYVDSDEAVLENGYVVSGAPVDNTLTCAYSVSTDLTDGDCDENGDLVLCVFCLDVSRTNIHATEISAGTSYFYENGSLVYIEPVTASLDEDFFIMLGDADGNRYINAADARLILRIAAKLETVSDEAMFTRCDVDKDSKITAKDARLVLRASAGLISSFDETEDDGNISLGEEESASAIS